jgi:predicted ATP-grasp superfamily ATP-dependent carboligase
LKPAVKNNEFRRCAPRKAFKLNTAKQVLDAYDTVSAWEPETVVQEWISGDDDRVAFALGYWDCRSKNLALFPGRKLRQWPPECGNTALAEPAPPEWCKELATLTAAIFDAVGYRGLGSLEYKVSREGRLVIMEPTVGRTNYQNEVAVLNGVNLPAIAYYDAMGMTAELDRLVSQASRPSRKTKFIDAGADYRSARFYMSQRRLGWREWLRSRSGPKRHVLYRHSDPLPFLAAVSRGIGSFIKHRIIKPALRPLFTRR